MRLEQAFEEEMSKENAYHRWPWPTLALAVFTMMFAAGAALAAIEREELRQFVERMLPTADAHESAISNDRIDA